MSRKSPSRKSKKPTPKVGENPQAAKDFGAANDFGAREDNRIEREYASHATRSRDKGATPGHSGGDGQRVSGVGANESGPGSGSGGDVDTDIIGLGSGGGTVAASGITHRPPGPDDAPQFPPRKSRRATPATQTVAGTTFDRSGGDTSTTGAGQGAASVSSPKNRYDDSSVGEISNDDASGADNSPSESAD